MYFYVLLILHIYSLFVFVDMWTLLISYIFLFCFFVIDGILNEEKSVNAIIGIEETLERFDVGKDDIMEPTNMQCGKHKRK